PWQLRFPRGRPARHRGRRPHPARGDADEGDVQLPVGARDLRRPASRRRLDRPSARDRARCRPSPDGNLPLMGAAVDYEQAGELKIGQVGIANLRIRTLDVAQLAAEMRERVERAPKLFSRAAVIVDFSNLTGTPDAKTAGALLDALRDAGVLPVALAYGSTDNARLAEALGLPLLAKFRAQYEPAAGGAGPDVGAATAASPSRETPVGAATAASSSRDAGNVEEIAAIAAPTHAGQPGLMQSTPVRSGQQVYAANRAVTVSGMFGAGAAVIADGSIHVYGALRGRALAGAQGNEKARIFCREFLAELVAIAGHYKVLEEIPQDLRGKPAQVWLERGELKIAALD